MSAPTAAAAAAEVAPPREIAPLCFLDTETDGVHPERQVWEVGAIRREPGGAEREYHAFVAIDLSTSDPFGLRVGRFYQRHPTGRVLSRLTSEDPPRPAWEVATQVARITHGAHIIGAVPSFDTEVLHRLLRDHRLAPAWHYRLYCVESVAAGYLRRPVGGLARCAEALGIDPIDPHTALGDVRTAMAIWDRVMSGA